MVEDKMLKELEETQARHTEEIRMISHHLDEMAANNSANMRLLSELKVAMDCLTQKHDVLAPLVSQLVKGKETEAPEGSNRSYGHNTTLNGQNSFKMKEVTEQKQDSGGMLSKPFVKRKTKIVCTMGPSTNTKEMIWKLADEGMNVARLNMSHGDHASHHKVIDLVKEYNAQAKDNVIAIMLDTKGPEVRSGDLPQPIMLETGQEFTFTIKRGVGAADCVSVSYDDFVNDVEAGDMLLVDGGATCVGKTVVDDMALSIGGESKHYGTPTNPSATARIPEGVSSGAVVAAAAKLVDFSLGIDSDGGVRVPVGYCGILGFRPSYGTVSVSGLIPVLASVDTVGWFAKDPSILRRVGHVLLQVPFAAQRNPRNILIADDCFRLSKVTADRLTQVVLNSIEKLYGRQALRRENLGDYLNLKVPSLNAFNLKQFLSNGDGSSSPIIKLGNAMQKLKRHEFRQNHSEWISSVKPILDPVVSKQVSEGIELSDSEIENCHTIRSELRSAINGLLKDDVDNGGNGPSLNATNRNLLGNASLNYNTNSVTSNVFPGSSTGNSRVVGNIENS